MMRMDIQAAIPVARRVAYKFAGRGVPTDELLSEAYFTLVSCAETYRAIGSCPFDGYVACCVRHAMFGLLKRRRWQQIASLDGDDMPAQPDVRARDPADLASAREQVEAVRRQLSARVFAMLWELHGEGRPQTEVAARHGTSQSRLGLTVAAAKMKLADRARGIAAKPGRPKLAASIVRYKFLHAASARKNAS